MGAWIVLLFFGIAEPHILMKNERTFQGYIKSGTHHKILLLLSEERF
jgi:hypothetical protein